MIYPAETDIIPFVKHLVFSLQPYAQANELTLFFEDTDESAILAHQPFDLLQSLAQLICQIINLIPHKSIITVRVKSVSQNKQAVLEVENSGINLIQVNQISNNCRYKFETVPLENGTIYRLLLSHDTHHESAATSKNTYTAASNIPKFYSEVGKRMHFHFTQSEKLVAALSEKRPQEAAFLQKINALITANLGDENFDTEKLGKAMAMSRTQLFRRLKPLIRQAPAHYIKTMRLQKAKELLETTDLTVGEVAFKTGFQTQSNFTKVFGEHYGILPSVFKRNSKGATNE